MDCTKEASSDEADLSHARHCFRKQLQHGLRHSLFGESAPKNTRLTQLHNNMYRLSYPILCFAQKSPRGRIYVRYDNVRLRSSQATERMRIVHGKQIH